MRRLYRLTAVVFLVLWVPITAHCYLEKIPALAFLQCSAESDCAGDGCQVIESGLYKISDNSLAIPQPVTGKIVSVVPAPLDVPLLDRSPCGLLSDAKPDLPRRWQFIARTALPVRAPSLLS
jgi:hypothetical protein